MAKGGTVKRKRTIRSYAGVGTGTAKFVIQPMTDNAIAYAKQRVPVDSGELKNSIHGDVRGLVGMVKAGGPGAKHAHLIEYGTRYMRARSFMRYAARKASGEVRRFFRGAFQEALREQRR